MTHNIIHDETKIGEIINDIPYELLSEMKYGDDNMIIEAMKQYAEHTLVKFIDNEMDRLKDEREASHSTGYWSCVEDSIEYMQLLKAQLTKSKPVDNSQEKDNK